MHHLPETRINTHRSFCNGAASSVENQPSLSVLIGYISDLKQNRYAINIAEEKEEKQKEQEEEDS